MQAADVMVKEVVTVAPDTRVEDIADTLITHHISAVPVVDAAGAVVGIVSEGDLMRRTETGTEPRRSWWLRLLTANEVLEKEFIKAHARRAAELMSRPVISVAPDTPLGDIAALLERRRIKRVPVVDNGRLVGIVSRADLVNALLRAGRTVPVMAGEAGLRARLYGLREHTWWPSDINIIVSNDNVEVWGVVDTELEKNAVKVAVEELAGPRRVEDHLSIRAWLPSGA